MVSKVTYIIQHVGMELEDGGVDECKDSGSHCGLHLLQSEGMADVEAEC